MAFVNFATREITAKIVFYGPGLGGKTTSLQYIHNSLSPENRGKMISLATEEDRTIYFDFLPLHLGKIQDFAVRVQLYTVPGQVRYNATRKLVLRGADGVVFVADSQTHKKLANVESYSNMEDNLREHGKDLRDLPHVLQFNKIDLPNVLSAEELNLLLNKYNVPFFETCATSGIGVMDALKSITKLVFNDLSKKALLQKKAKTRSTPTPQFTMEAAFSDTANSAAHIANPASASADPPLSSYFKKPEFSREAVQDAVMTKTDDESFAELEIEEVRSEPLQSKPPEETPVIDLQDDIQEVEPIAEFDQLPSKHVSYESDYALKGNEQIFPRNGDEFSYRKLFGESDRFGEMMAEFESQVQSDPDAALIKARSIYSYLVSQHYPTNLVLDDTESFMALALNLKFNRYLKFKRLLDSQDRPEAKDLLFLHHFLSELYLSLKEL